MELLEDYVVLPNRVAPFTRVYARINGGTWGHQLSESGNFERVLLAPWGEVRSSSGDFIMDEESARLITAAFRDKGVYLPIDYEHQTMGGEHASPSGQAPAAGWITDIEPIPGAGLFVHVSWTPKGRDAITSREYRYLSPVVIVRKSDRRVSELHSAALTNKPAIVAATPIANKQSADARAVALACSGPGASRSARTMSLTEIERESRELRAMLDSAERAAVLACSGPAVNTQAVVNRAGVIAEADATYTANAEIPCLGAAGLSRLCSRQAFVNQALRDNGMELLSECEVKAMTVNALDGEWQANSALRREFGDDKNCWLAFKKASDADLVRIFNAGG